MLLLNVEQEIKSIAEHFLRKVKQSGPNNIMAVCPFHRKMDGSEEHRPSFAMNISNGLYLCHSCQTRGNLYTFLRDLGVSRNDLTIRFGAVIEAATQNAPPKFNHLDPKIVETDPLPESMLGLFDQCPTVLLAAGFTQETLRHFDVGYDYHHQRITFPLRDFQGRLAGISGRDVTGNSLRYKVYDKEYADWNMPIRPSLEKRKLLWNIHDIYPGIYHSSEQHNVVIVEGFKACMWVWQAGITNVVALLGTYLSEEQKLILERLGITVYLFLDYNEAGLKGTSIAVRSLCKSLPVKIMQYPERIVRASESAQPDSLTKDEILSTYSTAIDYLPWQYSLEQQQQTVGA